jgi:hypothetical protein
MAETWRTDESGWPRSKYEIRWVLLSEDQQYDTPYFYEVRSWSPGPWRDWQEANDQRDWTRHRFFVGSKTKKPEFVEHHDQPKKPPPPPREPTKEDYERFSVMLGARRRGQLK